MVRIGAGSPPRYDAAPKLSMQMHLRVQPSGQMTKVPSHFNPKIPKESFVLAVLEKRVLWYALQRGVSRFANVDLCDKMLSVAVQSLGCCCVILGCISE